MLTPLPALAAAFLLMIPLAPAAENATLAALVTEGFAAELGYHGEDDRAAINNWSGDDCHSQFQARFDDGAVYDISVDWSAKDSMLVLIRKDIMVMGGLSGPSFFSRFFFTFGNEAKAKAAYVSMGRLRAACKPQR